MDKENETKIADIDDMMVVDSAEFQRGQRLDEVEKFVQEAEKTQEPEIETQDEEQREPRTENRGQTSPPVNEDLARALSTIDRLERENLQHRTRLEVLDDRTRRAAEPNIEYVEVLPGTGIQLPKDPDRWPIRLTKEMVAALNINPDVAPGLNTLANALFVMLNNATTRGVFEAMESRRRVESVHRSAIDAFHAAYPDLREHPEYVKMIEDRMRAEGVHLRGLSNEQYYNEIANRTRSSIARLRGISNEEYLAQVRSNGKQMENGPSRSSQVRSRATLSRGTQTRSSRQSGTLDEMGEMMRN